jgi:flagella basal body P-ring formation protein FlgA
VEGNGTYRGRLLTALAVLAIVALAGTAYATQQWTAESAIRAHLKAHYPWADVDISDVWPSSPLPAEEPAAVVVEKAPPGRAVFRFDFPHRRSVTVQALVRTFDRVYLSRGAFRKEHVLQPDDIYATLMETGRIPKGAVRSGELLVGKPLVRQVVPNMPITDSMVSQTPLVKQGRKVTLAIESPGFTIRTAGETRSDAAVGEYVKVINLASRKMTTGILVDESTVRVEY